MSDIELVIKNSKALEAFLERHFNAQGRGLHEKIGSVEGRLPDPLVRRLRFIATIRNKVVHEDGYDRIDDRRGFMDACSLARRELRQIAGVRGTGWRRAAAIALLAFVVVAFIYYIFFRR